MIQTGPTGQAWQDHVACLCRIECGLRKETYQPIPDRVQGDGGLEGITTDGEGYQCFADQDSLSTSDRVEKQKGKIRTDLLKLKKYEEYWTSIFVTTKLKKWFLVTPGVPDKAIIAYARKHAKKIRDLNLPFIDDAFEAFVVTDDHFQKAKDWRANQGVARIDFQPDSVSQKALDDLKSDFVANTERKLKQVLPNQTQSDIALRRDDYLKWYLEHQNVLAKVFSQDPELFERLKNFCSQHEEDVKFDSTIDDTAPNRRLMNLRQILTRDLDRDFNALGKATLYVLARGSIASWLGNCPLEFITGANNE